jgi:PAS domain S-box-containing protein
MTAEEKLTCEELELRLHETEEIIGALRHHEVDAIVGETKVALVRLREVEEALRKAKEELELRVAERTAELAKVNEQLQGQAELLDLAHDMIFVHDMDGRITFWNRGAEQTLGFTRDEAVGQLSHRLLQTEYCEPLIRITARIIREGRWEGELVHTTRDGRQLAVASRWALRRGPEGQPVAILEIDSDITDRKRAEQETAEAKRFAEDIVDTVQQGLIMLDPRLRVVSANRWFHETFQTTPERVQGRRFYALQRGRWNVPELRGRLSDVLPTNTGFAGLKIECRFPDGSCKPLVLSARPVHGRNRGSELILVVIQDITVQKQHEREIQADKTQLSALTEELIVTEERQRQQIAAALHDSICQSLAFAKRELSALERSAPSAMRERLRQARDQVAEAIDQARNLTLELAPSILYTLGLEAAIEDLAEQFDGCHRFACHVRTAQEPSPLSDPVKSMLYRAVRELLVNASKHAQAKNVSIGIEREGSNMRITVEDDGRGFDPRKLKDRSTKEGGFGLFSVQQRLTHVGGRLLIESAEGKGTKATLLAPLNLT